MANEKKAIWKIDVSAKKKPIRKSNVQFFSYDDQTAVIGIEPYAGEALIDVGTISKATIAIESVNHAGIADSKVIFSNTASIVGKNIEYVIPKEVLAYQGYLAFEIYLDYKDSKKSDSSERIIFENRVSMIDRNAGQAELVYIKDMETAKQEVADKAAEVMADMDQYESGLDSYRDEKKAEMDGYAADVETASANAISAVDAEAQRVSDHADEKITEYDEKFNQTNANISQLTDELVEAQDDINQIQSDIASGKIVTETKLVDYWTGEPIVLEGVANFVGKTTGDVTGNPHYFGRNGATTGLVSPTGLWPEATQSQYVNLEKLDGKVTVLDGRQDTGYYAQIINKFNLIEQINRDHPNLYESVGANDLATKVAFVKKVLTSFEMTAYGRGSGPTGNKVTSVIWNGAAWVYAHTTTAGTITKLGYRLTDPRFLNDDGFMYNLIYAEPSDGTTASSVSIDTAQLAYSLNLSMVDFYVTRTEYNDLAARVAALETNGGN